MQLQDVRTSRLWSLLGVCNFNSTKYGTPGLQDPSFPYVHHFYQSAEGNKCRQKLHSQTGSLLRKYEVFRKIRELTYKLEVQKHQEPSNDHAEHIGC